MERFIMYYFTVECHNLLLFQYNNKINNKYNKNNRRRVRSSTVARTANPNARINNINKCHNFQFQTWNRVPFPPPPPETPCQNRCTSCPAVVAVARCPSCHQSRVISLVNRNCIRDSSLLLAARTTAKTRPTIATLRCTRTARPRSFPRRT